MKAKNLLFVITLIVSTSLFSKGISPPNISFQIANGDIALAEVISVADTSVKLKILDPIKGFDNLDTFFINPHKYSRFFGFRDYYQYQVGQKEILVANQIFNENLLTKYGGSELMYRNDSVFIPSQTFLNGCFYNKYYVNAPDSLNGYRSWGFSITDFKTIVNLISRKHTRFLKKLRQEPSIIKIVSNTNGGYNNKTGTMPIYCNKSILKFRNKSIFHEMIVDSMADYLLTTNWYFKP